MIDLREETTFRLSHGTKLIHGHAGKRVTASTLYRWAKDGIRGVRLETIRVGGSLFSSEQALQRFAERLSASDRPEAAPSLRTPARRRREIEAADRRLAEMGC